MDHTREIKDLEHGIRELEEAIEERMGAMPAHSLSFMLPDQMLRLCDR